MEEPLVDISVEALVNANAKPEMIMFYKYVLRITSTEQIVVPIDIGISTQCKEVYLGKVEIFDFLAQAQIGVCHFLIYMS